MWEGCAALGVYFSCSVLCTVATPATVLCCWAWSITQPCNFGVFSLKQCQESLSKHSLHTLQLIPRRFKGTLTSPGVLPMIIQ